MRVGSDQATKRDRWSVVALERTFDIAVQLSLGMEILKAPEELTDDDSNVLFSEDAGLHLRESMSLESGRGNRDRVGDRQVD